LGGDFKDTSGREGYRITEELFYYVINIPPVATMDDLSLWFGRNFKEEEVVSVEPVTVSEFYTQKIKVVLKKKIVGRIQLGGHARPIGCRYDRFSASGRIFARSTSPPNGLFSKYPTNTSYASVTAGVIPTYATTYTKDTPVGGTGTSDHVMLEKDKQIADTFSQMGREERWADVPDSQPPRGSEDHNMGVPEDKPTEEAEEVESSEKDTENDRRDFPTLDQLTKRQKKNVKVDSVKDTVRKARVARELKKLNK